MFSLGFIWNAIFIGMTYASIQLECIQTINDVDDVYNRPLTIERIQNYRPKGPSHGDREIYFDPCLEMADSKLAFHWEILNSDATGNFGNYVIQCLKTTFRNNHFTEELNCYKFTILSSERKGDINCWAKLTSYEDILLMKAYAAVHDGSKIYHLYSELITSGMDALCKQDQVEGVSISTIIHGCNTSGYFTLKTNYNVKAISAKDANDIIWHLPFQLLDSRRVEFRLMSGMKGKYNLTIVLYHTGLHMYFAYIRQINVICSLETMSTPSDLRMTDSGVSFPVFATVMTIGLLVVFVVVIACIMNIQRIQRTLRRRRAMAARRPSEMATLNNAQGQGAQFLPRPPVTSRPSSSQYVSIPLDTTDGALANTDLKKYKRIVVLPLSYDHFVRDVIHMLKDILSFQGNVIFKCIYDQNVIDEYNRNKWDWVNSVLQDTNTVIIVLQFTALDCERRETTCVDTILEHCRRSRIRPQSPLYFVNMTGRDYGQHEYYGETIIIKDQDDVKGLVAKVFAECGFIADRDARLHTEALQSTSFDSLVQTVIHKR